MFYFIKTPKWMRLLFKSALWQVNTHEKIIYLTFDDGPHPKATSFVLNALRDINAKATFFCIGKNVIDHPDIYERIIEEGHSVGNHTQNHLNGWKTRDDVYLNDIAEAMKHIDSKLFRPPYGRITQFQVRQLKAPAYQLMPVMWTVLSGDFDPAVNNDKCLENVILNAEPGSIVLFHDSAKCFEKMSYALPGVLKYFKEKGYRFESLSSVIF